MLASRFGFLAETWFLLLVSVWLLLELAIDKLPQIATLNDLLNAPLRPAAAALLFSATETPASDVHILVAAAAGAAAGAAVHWLKSSYRRRIAGRAGGLAGLAASMAEDALVVAVVFLAAFVPPVSLALLALAAVPALRLALAPRT